MSVDLPTESDTVHEFFELPHKRRQNGRSADFLIQRIGYNEFEKLIDAERDNGFTNPFLIRYDRIRTHNATAIDINIVVILLAAYNRPF